MIISKPPLPALTTAVLSFALGIAAFIYVGKMDAHFAVEVTLDAPEGIDIPLREDKRQALRQLSFSCVRENQLFSQYALLSPNGGPWDSERFPGSGQLWFDRRQPEANLTLLPFGAVISSKLTLSSEAGHILQAPQTIALQLAPDRYLDLRIITRTQPANDRAGDFELVGKGVLTEALCDIPIKYGERHRSETH